MGILAQSTIRYLAGVITGDGAPSPHRTMRELVGFFSALGVPLSLDTVGGRGPLTLETLEALNEAKPSNPLRQVVQASVDPRHYLPELRNPNDDKEVDAVAVLRTLNECLGYDGHELVPRGGGYRMVLTQLSVPSSEGLHDGGADLPPSGDAPEPHTVFVVHGRNTDARDAMYEFLGAVGLNALDWEQALDLVPEATPYIGDVLDASFARAQAIVVLLTPDDNAQLRPEYMETHDEGRERGLTGQPRPNVFFEAGMAMGLMRNRTVLVAFPGFRPFSDIDGRHILRAAETSAFREQMVNRLKRAGCPVDEAAVDWRVAGDFAPSGEPPEAADPATQQDGDVADRFAQAVSDTVIEWMAERDTRPASTERGERILTRLIETAVVAAEAAGGDRLRKLITAATSRAEQVMAGQRKRFWELGDALFVWMYNIATHGMDPGDTSLLPTIHHVCFVHSAFLGREPIRAHPDDGDGEWVEAGDRSYGAKVKDRPSGPSLLDDLLMLDYLRSDGGSLYSLTPLANELFKVIATG